MRHPDTATDGLTLPKITDGKLESQHSLPGIQSSEQNLPNGTPSVNDGGASGKSRNLNRITASQISQAAKADLEK